MGTLDAILKPRGIAVIGASRTPNSIGHQVVHNLVHFGYTGAVFPVNPKAPAIHGIKAYPRIGAVPDPVDLAVVVVPKEGVLDVAEECGAARVKALVVISAGFREVDGAGAARERELVAVARRHGMRVVGPNCMGVLNTDAAVAMNATFAPSMPPAGRAAFVSQSGALGVSVLDYAREYGIGIAQFVSMGNKADVSGNDLLTQWEDDPAVGVILMYVESFGNPVRFLEIASRITRRKPIVVVKSGRSAVGARAASSHTGALAASDAAVDALLAQAGVLRAGSIEELFDMAMAFSVLAPPRSRRTAVVTNSGGPGILAADALETQRVDLVELSPATVERLRPLFPAEASIRNPLDMIASATPEGYRTALDAVLSDPAVDSATAIFVPPLGTRQEDVAEAIVATAVRHRDKPVLAVLMGRDGLPEGKAELHRAGIPAYIFPESAARALGALCRHGEWQARPAEPAPPLRVDRARAAAAFARAEAAGRRKLAEPEALAVLEAYGIPVAPYAFAPTLEEGVRAAAAVGYPLVLKVVSPDIIHKTDVGGVRAGIGGEAELRGAWTAVAEAVRRAAPGAAIDGMLIQRMMRGGRETIAGLTRDAAFGPLVMFGLGGVYVEALRAVTFRVAPLRPVDADEMIRGFPGAALLGAVRGAPPADAGALRDILLRLSRLAADFPAIAELDINPLLAYADGACAVDARVLTAAPVTGARPPR